MPALESVLSGLEDKISKQEDKRIVLKQIMDNLFSSEPDKIIQTTRIKTHDLEWITPLELIKQFVVFDFCDYKNSMKIQNAINMLYQSRVSINGKGRDEMFEALKGESNLMAFMDMRTDNLTKKRVF